MTIRVIIPAVNVYSGAA